MKARHYLTLLATAATLMACAPGNRATGEDPDTAPGHASGKAPVHLHNAPGGGPEVHRPEPTFRQRRDAQDGPFDLRP